MFLSGKGVQCRFSQDDAYKDLSADGYLCKEKILAKCPSLRAPLETGLKYTHLCWEITVECPSLMRILSEADNAKHTVYNMETPTQTMYSIHAKALQRAAKTDAEWDQVVTLSLRSLGEEKRADLTNLAVFVRKLAGGPGKPFLIELDKYGKTLKVVREVPSAFMKDLANLELVEAPCFAIGMVKAMMSAADKWLFAGKLKLFVTSDLNSLKNQRYDMVLKAHALQLEFRDLGLQLGVHDEARFAHLLGSLDAKLCMAVTQKLIGKSLVGICIESWDELCKLFPNSQAGKAVLCPWVEVGVAAAKSSAPSTGRPMLKIDTRGVISEEVVRESFGMQVGSWIKCDKSGAVKIVAFRDGKVEVSAAAGGCGITDIPFQALARYSVCGVKENAFHPIHSILKRPEYLKEKVVVTIKSKLNEALEKETVAGETTLRTSPVKGLFATGELKKNCLRLIPWTSSVALIPPGRDAPKDAILFGDAFLGEGEAGRAVHAYLVPPKLVYPDPSSTVEPFVIHFWVVRVTHDLAEGNIVLVERSGSVPHYTNSVEVKAGTELCIYKPAKRAAEASICTVSSASGGDAEPPTGKARKGAAGTGKSSGKAARTGRGKSTAKPKR